MLIPRLLARLENFDILRQAQIQNVVIMSRIYSQMTLSSNFNGNFIPVFL